MHNKSNKFIKSENIQYHVNTVLIVIAIFILVGLALTGCTTTTQVSPVQSDIVLPEKPNLPIYELNQNSTDAQVAKAYIMSLELCLDRQNIVENSITP